MAAVRTLVVGLLACAGAASAAAHRPARPHLVVTLVDDLGWYNVPWKNPEQGGARLKAFVETEAVQLERFYTYKYCSPTRSSLLSGRLPYHVNEKLPGPLDDKVGGIHPDMTLISTKLKARGYATAMIGKGHLGARSAAFLPINRGFDYHFGFLGGGEDHNTQRVAGKPYVDLWLNDAPAYGKNGTNSCYLYARDAVRLIMAHDPATPLFLYLPFHDVHDPYQALPEYTDEMVPAIRRTSTAMMTCVADATMNVTDALKARNMWGDTLLLWASDNGGPQYWQGNNYPLRGGKWSDFEGGVRAVAFAAGGVLAPELRGSALSTVIHVADIYTTLCRLAGSPAAACADDIPGLPGVDGVDMRGFFTDAALANTTRPNPEIVISSDTLLDGDWKYTVYKKAFAATQTYCFYKEDNTGCGYWTGPQWPETPAHEPLEFDLLECDGGCLFNVAEDPTEHHDLSTAEPARFTAMRTRLAQLVRTAYQTQGDYGYTQCVTLDEYAATHRGFVGPACTKP